MGRTVFHARDYRLKLAEQVVDAARGHGNFVGPLCRQAQAEIQALADVDDCCLERGDLAVDRTGGREDQGESPRLQ